MVFSRGFLVLDLHAPGGNSETHVTQCTEPSIDYAAGINNLDLSPPLEVDF